MNNLSEVEQLLRGIESKPLSETIPCLLAIALECKDYKGYCVLARFISPVAENPETNTIQRNELIRSLLVQGLSKEDITRILKESTEEYIGIKTISENQVSSHSIKEMETWLPEAKKILDSAANTTQENYGKLAERITQVRQLYETMRGYVTSKLIYYHQLLKTPKKIFKEQEGSNPTNWPDLKKVFIVHGHNGEIKEAVARMIERQGIQAVILHEQANQGATIIEKFEKNSNVGGAVCLFTADDLGHAKSDSEEKHRARQNVVFETGYFIGKLGRDKVVLVADKGVEIPSDLQGVVYTETTSWQYSVLKELKAIGYNIDYNKLD